MEQDRDKTLERLLENSKQSTVLLKCKLFGLTTQVGSGFFLESDKIVTNIHVVEGSRKVIVRNPNQSVMDEVPIFYEFVKALGSKFSRFFNSFTNNSMVRKNENHNRPQSTKDTETYTIEGVVAYNAENDLVLLKVSETGDPLSLANCNDLKNGDIAYIVGYNGKTYGGITGNISVPENKSNEFPIKVRNLQESDGDGYSGGPVLNGQGELIGVVVSSISDEINNHGFINAVPLNVLKTLVDNSSKLETMRDWQKFPRIGAYSKASIGDHFLKNGMYKLAIKYYDAALKRNPDLAITYSKRGYTKDELGDYKGAIEDYTMAIKLKPSVSAYCNRGIAKKHLGDYKGAIVDYDFAIKLNPEDVSAYKNRGTAKQALGQYEEAEADFARAKELDADIKMKSNS